MIAAKLDRLLWRIPKKEGPGKKYKVIDTQGGFLRIRDSGGQGAALIFFCDPPVTSEAYDELIACFEPRYRVIVMELPSFGFSGFSNASAFTFDGAVRDTEAAIKSLSLDACILFGPCVCGFVAAELVARRQLPVKGLVLMQTPDKGGMQEWVNRMDPKGILRVPVLGQLIIRFTARRTSRFWLKYATAKRFDSARLVASCDQVLRQGGGYPLASMLQLWPASTKDANLDVPALAVWGKQDRSHKNTCSASTLKHAPGAQIEEFADCGHFTELEQPQRFSKAVMPFIEASLGADVNS